MTIGMVREIWRYPVKSMRGERLQRSDVGVQGLWGDRGWAVRDEVTGEIYNAKRFPALMQCAAAYREAPRADHIPHVEITFPDGARLGSDGPQIAERLSELMRRPVALHPLRPASDKAFYRRPGRGSRLMDAVAGYRIGRRFLAWVVKRGLAGPEVRENFGREAEEPMPDLTGIPAEAFAYYTPPGTYFDVFPIHVLTTSALARMSALNPGADWDVRRFRPNVLVEAEDADETGWAGRTVEIGGFTIKGEIPTVRCAMPMHAQADLPRDPSVLRTIVRDAGQCLGLYASVERPGSVAVGDEVRLSSNAANRA